MYEILNNRQLWLIGVLSLWINLLPSMGHAGPAQNVGGSIQGTIYDTSGAVIAQVAVQAVNQATGISRLGYTDEKGHFLIPSLPPGDYDVRASVTGFQTVSQNNLRLAVGSDLVIKLIMPTGPVQDAISVAAEVPHINLTSGEISGLTDERDIRDLPLNGRSFPQLALLQPGVSAPPAINSTIGGYTPKITVNGARPEMNSFLLDGTDINNAYNKTPGSMAGVLLGVDAIQEFQVLTNSYSSEFGRASGGVFNIVTRSGTNSWHGSAFEFHRNSALDARNFFDNPNQEKPSFRRHQFGGVFGGPLVKDRSFFFAAYEGLVERLGVTGVTSVPELAARQGVVNPTIRGYLDALFPFLPNGRSLGDGIGEYLFTRQQPTDEHLAQVRIDHRFSERDTVFGRYTYDNGSVDRQPTRRVPIFFIEDRSRNQYLTLEHQHLFSPRLLNIVRVGFNRSVQLSGGQRTVQIPDSLSFIPGEPFGFVNIAGQEIGGEFRIPRNDWFNNFQLADTVVVTKGRHALRLGVQGQYVRWAEKTRTGNVLAFSSWQTFFSGVPSSVQFIAPGRDAARNYRQTFMAFFLQDDVRVRSNLSLNLGLRYEFVTVPTETRNKISNLRRITDSAVTLGSPWHENPSLKNFAPRIGLAWDPFSDGKTSVRAGFGIFYDQFLPKYYWLAGITNPPFINRGLVQRPPFPNALANNPPILPQLHAINFDTQSPYVLQYNLNVQRSLPGQVDLMVGYVGSRGNHLIRVGDANVAPERIVNGVKVYQPQLGRRNPNFSNIFDRVTDAQSFYHSLQVTAARRLSGGIRAQASYTFSRSIDDASGSSSDDYDNTSQYGVDFYDRGRDRGLSAFHATHNLTFNWTWDLPFARSSRGVAAVLFKGWQLNNISSLRSGQPFTVRLSFNRSGNLNNAAFSLSDRPDLNPRFAGDAVLGGPDRYWDVNAYLLPPANQQGTLGRNTLIGPALVSIDMSLVKTFKVDEKRSFQFRAECFNAPNHPNFATPSGRTAFTGVRTDGSAIVAPDAGRITSTVTTSRQIQLGVKLSF
ncbi:MAG TPA: TonB-dependent receptor [Blastocatellia bacterium]|nr:TonB-dependent receptor [Blastocatellia bacterium]